MWGEILGLALVVSLNPVLLGFILLVISRPRPVQNLLTFWVGCLIVNAPAFLVTLFALHMVPAFADFAKDLATPDPHSGIQPLQLGTGLLALALAAAMMVRARVRQRAPASATVGADGGSSVLVLDTDTSSADAPARPGRIRTALANLRAAFGRFVARLHDAWEGGALWVSLVFGMGYLPPPPLVLLVDTMIVGSGLPIGTQVVAAVVFVLAMLTVFEITLLCYVVAPTRTQAVLAPVHDWALAHRQQVLIGLFVVVGVWQVLIGAGLL
ncbi:GAP family protein [Mycobacterium sp. NPDC003449]